MRARVREKRNNFRLNFKINQFGTNIVSVRVKIETMRKLKDEFKKNGIRYKLIKRTDDVAMYGQLGEYTDDIISIEVFQIVKKDADERADYAREAVPSNSDFGINYGARAFCGKGKFEEAEAWYESLVRNTGGDEVIDSKPTNSADNGFTPHFKGNVSGMDNDKDSFRLPSVVECNGYECKLLVRDGNIAIYEQHHPLGGLIAYEVIFIRVMDERTLFGRKYPRQEVYPKSSEWGQYGWTFTTLENAERRFNALREKAKRSQRQGEKEKGVVL